MAFCSMCGKPISTTARFCGFCGYPIQQGPVKSEQANTKSQAGNKAPPREMSKDEVVHELCYLVDYFSVMQEKYDEYDRCNKWFDEKERQIRKRRRNKDNDLLDDFELLLSGDLDSLSTLFYTLGIVLIFVIVFILFLVDMPYSILIAIGSSYFSSLFFFLGVYYTRKAKRQKRETEREMNNKIKTLVGELVQYYKKYGDCIVSFNDSNPRILLKIKNNLVSGKATTLEKATEMARRQALWR